MSTGREDAAHEVGPLGSSSSPAPGDDHPPDEAPDDAADGMAGPVVPSPETEPDARRRGGSPDGD